MWQPCEHRVVAARHREDLNASGLGGERRRGEAAGRGKEEREARNEGGVKRDRKGK